MHCGIRRCRGFRVARLGLFEAKNNLAIFKRVGFEISENLLSIWAFLSLKKFI